MRPGKKSARVGWIFIRMAVLFVALVLFSLPSIAHAQEAAASNAAPKGILILYWYNREYAGNITFEQNFRTGLQSAPTGSVEYYSEYLESNRFPGEDQELLLRNYLREKYAGRKIDVIIAVTDKPLEFLLKYRSELFTNVPIVFVAVKSPTSTELAAGPGVTGIVYGGNQRNTLEMALRLHADTEQVFIVSGTLDHDKRFELTCRKDLEGLESKAAITYLTDLPLGELIARVRSLPERSIILYLWQQSYDEKGSVLEAPDVLALIAPSTRAPIYGLTTPMLGNGIIGGHLRVPGRIATSAAEIAMQIVSGTRAQDIPVQAPPTVPMFDWRQLERWGISEDDLPPGSIVEFRVPTLWAQYKWYAIALISVLILQTMLIAGLIIHRSRRKRAEVERERFAALAELERARLDDVVSHVPGIVWESYVDPAGGARQLMFVSEYAETMLGYSVEEWMATPAFAQSITHAEDRDRVARATASILHNGGEGALQFRWIAKDGRQVWVETHLAATRDETGDIVGLRGVTIDITERKWAEEALRATQESLTIALEASQMGTWDLDLTRDFSGHRSLRHDQIFGYDTPQSDWGREVARRHIVEEDREIFDNAFAEAMVTGNLDFEARVRWPDGSIHWIAARGRFYFDKDGQPTRGAGVNYDITERKLADEALDRIEERNRAILRAIPDLMFLHTSDGVYLDYQANDPRDLLVPPSEFLGKNIRDVMPAELTESFLASFRRARETDEPQSVEYMLPLNGEERWFEARIVTTQGDKVLSVVRDITDRKRAEEHLRESEASRLLAQQAARIGTFEWNIQTGVNIGSTELEAMYGLRPGSFDGTHPGWEGLVHADDLPRALASVQKALNTGAPVEEEWRVTWPDGSIHWIFARFQAVTDSTGAPLKLTGINIDITNRKVTEEALRESQARLAGVIGSAMDAIVSIDRNQRIVLFNNAAEKMFGCEEREVLGQPLDRFIPEQFRETHSEHVRAFGDSNITKRSMGSPGSIYGRRIDGEQFPIEASISQLELHGQKFYTVILRDITKRQQAVEALRESEERFRNMADAAPVMIWISGIDKLCYYFNRQWLDFTGRTMEQEIGNGWAEGMHPEDLARCLQIYSDSFDRREQFTMEYKLLRADGQYRWVIDIGTPQFSVTHKFLGYIGSCIDITERKEAEKSLANLSGQLIRAREDECARIARELHDDVNQRMALVSIEMEQLGQRPGTPDSVRNELAGLLVQIAETSREIQRMSRDLHPSKLVHLGLVSTLKSLFEELRHRHVLEIGFTSGNLPADLSPDISLCLYRIVQECLNNIIKHSGAQACEVELLRNKNEIRLRVSDSGAGFDTESPSMQKGLGLISMRERLRLVGGSLSIDSRPSRGTQIDARVPIGPEGLRHEGTPQEDKTRGTDVEGCAS